MTTAKLAPYQLFNKFFKLKNLKHIFESNIKSQQSRGIDRINGYQFSQQAKKHLKIIKNKCINKTYQFSPYSEILKAKGRNKSPRIIAVPTVRDRIVLYALKEILSDVFSDCVRRKLANTYIHDIQKVTQNIEPKELGVFGTDIINFYGSINRELLIQKISTRIKSQKILTLIERAISTPIVPKNYRKQNIDQYKTSEGVPQGLSISNILADIYVSEDIDGYIQDNYSCDYFRYVDDILIFCNKNCLNQIENIIQERLSLLELENHKAKTFCNTGEHPFEYLGYRFELPKITVRQSSIDKFIASIAAKFSDYAHNKQKKLKQKTYLTEERLKEIFLIELNEKITGAISKNKRYGWIFYFHAITDLSVLYKIDNIICNFFKRLPDFKQTAPTELKKLSRAYYEVKDIRKINSGYIHNYNQYKDELQKQSFLVQRGFIEPSKNYSNADEIDRLYQQARNIYLSQLEKDNANIY